MGADPLEDFFFGSPELPGSLFLVGFTFRWRVVGVAYFKLAVPILFLLSPIHLIRSGNVVCADCFSNAGHRFCYDCAHSWLDAVEDEAVPGEPKIPTEGGRDAFPDSN